MKPKEKAQELVDKYSNYTTDWDYLIKAKLCTLIAVDEILNALPPFDYGLEFVAKIDYWTEVKTEIENL